MGGVSLLEAQSVGKGTRGQYEKLYTWFRAWASTAEITVDSVESLDAALCDFFDALFLNGEEASIDSMLITLN